MLRSEGTIQVQLPLVESLPLFTGIPIRILITCYSKPAPSSQSFNAASFTFPRIPNVSDIRLELFQSTRIIAGVHKQQCRQSYGYIGGFGCEDKSASITSETKDPVWIPDEHRADKGRWMESVAYSTHFSLQCPTPVRTRLIKSEVRIRLPNVCELAAESVSD
jgi:hypothetical protein